MTGTETRQRKCKVLSQRIAIRGAALPEPSMYRKPASLEGHDSVRNHRGCGERVKACDSRRRAVNPGGPVPGKTGHVIRCRRGTAVQANSDGIPADAPTGTLPIHCGECPTRRRSNRIPAALRHGGSTVRFDVATTLVGTGKGAASESVSATAFLGPEKDAGEEEAGGPTERLVAPGAIRAPFGDPIRDQGSPSGLHPDGGCCIIPA